ncbi:exported protein of unknown function [uncultured Woeseiaceae bacterium]|uniref:Lipoprotein n=1 Tax=uncultured Woeseiaceae bacterium TaxID=1983305 RepID=A0A7D9H3P5_9GAMM|nr:exported protein of unknown function [uncultured Woeseiaceae bacterium]
MQRLNRVNLLSLLSVLAVIAIASACATTPASNVIKTVDDIEGAAPFSNILVVSVAGDIATRTEFEQAIANAISTEETTVTPFYTVVGRTPQFTRNILNNVVRAREFDAIILTRLQGQDRADLVPNRPTGRLFDLYLYDYAELNYPADIEVGSTVSFVVEVYDTRTAKKVWAIESLIFDSKTVESVLSEQLAAISAEILRDGLVRR